LCDTIIILPSSPVLAPRLLEIAEQWLKIHGKNNHILSLFLLQPQYLAFINRPGPSQRSQIFRIVEDGILPVARFTKFFSCSLSTKYAIDAFFTIPHAIFHCLESLELSVAMLPDQELARATKKAIKEESRRFTAFQNLPRLRSAIITIENGIHPLAFRLPWSQLTKLDMIKTTIHPHIFLDVLSSSAPSLKDGSFTIRFKKVMPSSSSAPKNSIPIVKLPFLQNLRLRLIDPTLDTRIFSRIRMRSLCHLRIDLVQDRRKTGWVVSIYQKLLSKSSNKLESLTFWDASLHGYDSENKERGPPTLVYSPPQDLDGLFAKLPKLQYLHLPIGLFIPQNSADKIAQGILLPSLRILDASSTVGLDILDIVRRRNELAFHRPGSSKLANGAAGIAIHPPILSHVLLLTSSDYLSKVELEKRYLESSSSSQRTAFDIRYVDFSL
jgi:hypothetical protein